MKLTAFIFARGGSKRIPNKNIKMFAGKPLIAWTIETCLSIDSIERVIVSTDSKKIASISKKYGASVPFLRPKYLSSDIAGEFMSWKHALKYLKKTENYIPEYFLSLPTTSPLRNKRDILNCVKEIKKKNTDLVLTASKTNLNPYYNMIGKNKAGNFSLLMNKKKYSNSQDAPVVYGLTTVAYLAKSKFILSLKKSFFETKNIRIVEIPIERSLDIDTDFEFKIAEQLMNERLKKKNELYKKKT